MYFQSSYLLQFLNLLTSIKTYKIALQLFATLTFRRLNTINDANISHYLAGQLYLVLVNFSRKLVTLINSAYSQLNVLNKFEYFQDQTVRLI